MTTLTKYTPEAATAVRGLAAGQLRWALSHAVRTFEAVPDDRLDYKITETAKSPREQIEHLLSGNEHVGRVLGLNLSLQEGSNDKAALTERLSTSTEAIAKAIEAVPDDSLDGMVDFFGPMPMPIFLNINFWHISRHAGQIDYIQTVYGDMEDRF